MHPEMRETAPGACGKCGMALETEVPPALHQTEYTCPMHPEVVQAEPGAWPYSHRKNLGCCNRTRNSSGTSWRISDRRALPQEPHEQSAKQSCAD
jgi:hypothetical protein